MLSIPGVDCSIGAVFLECWRGVRAVCAIGCSIWPVAVLGATAGGWRSVASSPYSVKARWLGLARQPKVETIHMEERELTRRFQNSV